ncbi:hypothetical protein HRbin40_00494 [bacterium HR40]|nr:hypothetical protein HRbin40_00494 [bacterium HR40]
MCAVLRVAILAVLLASLRVAQATETVTVAPRLVPGTMVSIDIERERAVEHDGQWLVEAKSRTLARLGVVAENPHGHRLVWRIERIDPQLVPGDLPEVTRRLSTIVEGLAFVLATDAARRPLGIAERAGVRASLRSAVARAAEAIVEDLTARGLPAAQAQDAAERMAQPFFDLAAAPDARFDAVHLQDPAVVLDLAGRSLVVASAVTREESRVVAVLGEKAQRLLVQERADWQQDARGERLLVVERTESLAEPIAPAEVLARFPGLQAVIASLDPQSREKTLEGLPPGDFVRHTVWRFDPGSWWPVGIEREETVRLGTLARRTLARYRLVPQRG